MAKDFKQAIPTEYKGIVYRSKCEAMFARYLELDLDEFRDIYRCVYKKRNVSGHGLEGGFIYEPEGFAVEEWKPDFLEWRTLTSELFGAQIPHCHYNVIEYKPSKPTATYIKRFAARCGVIYARFRDAGLIEFCGRTSFYIYWGSVFSESCGRIVAYVSDDGRTCAICDDEFNWVVNYEDEIRETRFDLEAVER